MVDGHVMNYQNKEKESKQDKAGKVEQDNAIFVQEKELKSEKDSA